MHWKLVAAFLRDRDQPWIHQRVPSAQHSFDAVIAGYHHDRSRKATSLRQWVRQWQHAWEAWERARRCTEQPFGFVAVFPPLAVCIGLLKRLTGSPAPVVAWSFNLGRAYGGVRRRLAAFALRRVNLFVVHSRREIDIYAAMLGLPSERFTFVRFAEELADPGCSEDRDDPFVFAAGSARRDYATLVEAVRPLGARTVIVAGRDALRGLALPPNVTARSGVSLAECHALCQRARVNVVPLDNEETASGQVTVRYIMLFGKPVIATRSIGTEDYIEDGVTGILVPPRDPQALRAAIRRVWDDPGRYAAMGAAGRDWMLRHADFADYPARLLEALERARTIAT
jgi:glycosyltransferase involved in cell wall biosynthesis